VVTWGLPAGVNPAESPDVIFGPKGAAYVQFGMRHQEARVLRHGGAWETLASSDLDMYQNEIAAFARCILEDQPVPAGGPDGRAALRVALAALESMDTGQAVKL
jgi:predicted dehydrogenase